VNVSDKSLVFSSERAIFISFALIQVNTNLSVSAEECVDLTAAAYSLTKVATVNDALAPEPTLGSLKTITSSAA